MRKRTSTEKSIHYRPRTSPITIPNKDLHKTIKCPVVIANRRRSRHTKRPNNCIQFVRAAKLDITGLAGDRWVCPLGPYSPENPGNDGRPRFRVMRATQRKTYTPVSGTWSINIMSRLRGLSFRTIHLLPLQHAVRHLTSASRLTSSWLPRVQRPLPKTVVQPVFNLLFTERTAADDCNRSWCLVRQWKPRTCNPTRRRLPWRGSSTSSIQLDISFGPTALQLAIP